MNYAVYIRRLMKVILKPNARIICLDLGCGDGFFTKIFSELVDLSVGIDLKISRAWYTRQGDKCIFVTADARSIPLRSSAADAVIIISLLEHIPNWKVVVSEVSRVLKPCAIVIIQLPNLYAIIEPHTHFPLLSLMPAYIRNFITLALFHEILQWDCNTSEVIYTLKRSGLKVLGIFRYNYMKMLGPVLFAQFIIAMKVHNSKIIDT
jgi:ubiquinone/menaquinone biosynthesis C-methylase UbiE